MIPRLIKLAVSLVFWVVDFGTRSLLSFFGRKYPGTCVVIYYHFISNEQRPKFARQMDELRKLARPISLNDLPNFEPGARYTAVTFDDGFRESIETAMPELAQRKIPVTIFIPTGCLGHQPTWLEEGGSEDQGGVIVTCAEIREIGQNDVVAFGSHCMTHHPLTSLSDEQAKGEMFQSKSDLEGILNREVRTLSFPHGVFNETHVELAKQAGYERVFSILPTFAFSSSDEFVVGRVRVDPTDWPVEFRLKLLGAYRWLSVLRRRGGINN